MQIGTVILVALLAYIQYPLWLGHGGWLEVHELREEVARQNAKNEKLRHRNELLEADVRDLQDGSGPSVEERPRYEMGMVKDDEVFVQFVSPDSAVPAVAETSQDTNHSTQGEMTAKPFLVVPNPVSRTKQEMRRDERESRRTAARDHRAHSDG